MPTSQRTEVVAHPDDALVVGPVTFPAPDLERLAGLPFAALRRELATCPRWTRYVIGVAVVLVRHEVIDAPLARLEITSDLPVSVGVASSAALEVATARALGASDIDPLRLAALCQEAENHVVGAPCGIMDQVAVVSGTAKAVLPILCRPASVADPVALPAGFEIVGWPTGAPHDVGGVPYRRARAATFMGKRMVEGAAGRAWPWVSQLPRAAVEELPDVLEGRAFLEEWGETDDDVTVVQPDETYPVRAATSFGVEEHGRSVAALTALREGKPERLGPLMEAQSRRVRRHGPGPPERHGDRQGGVGPSRRARRALQWRRLWRHRRGPVRTRGALDDVDGLIR